MDAIALGALLLWFTMSAVQERLLRNRLGLDWGWWTIANLFTATVGFVLGTFVSFSVLFSYNLDLFKIRDTSILLGLFFAIFGPISILTQWIVLKRQSIYKPLWWSLLNVISAIVTCILLIWFNKNTLWNNDWKVVVGSVLLGAMEGAATAKACDYFCYKHEQYLLQQTDEYWEEQAWKE